MKPSTYIKLGAAAAVVLLIAAGLIWLNRLAKGNYIDLGTGDRINMTPTQIKSIRNIGEWEFLSVSAEELVDTVRKGLFSNDELVRIYYGTLRIGVNMQKVDEGWIHSEGDSITVTMPRIGLLDEDFIDEARTKSFYESGTWKAADREALYRKAYRQMLVHGLTRENLREAEVNADQQMRNLLHSLGYKKVGIKFQE